MRMLIASGLNLLNANAHQRRFALLRSRAHNARRRHNCDHRCLHRVRGSYARQPDDIDGEHHLPFSLLQSVGLLVPGLRINCDENSASGCMALRRGADLWRLCRAPDHGRGPAGRVWLWRGVDPVIAVILICAAALAPGDCNEHTARQVLIGGDAATLTACLQEAAAFLARSALKPGVGEYPRFECRRPAAFAQKRED